MLTTEYLGHNLIFQKKADKITLNLISIKGCVSFLWVYCFDVFHPVGTPLYCDRSEYSAEKFGYVVKEVLLPLALDYHVRSRTNEVDAVASAEVTNLNGDTSVFNAAVKVWRVRWWYFQHVPWKTTKLPYSQNGILLKFNFSTRFFQTYVKIIVLVTIIATRDHHKENIKWEVIYGGCS